jgi:hypothetical protein
MKTAAIACETVVADLNGVVIVYAAARDFSLLVRAHCVAGCFTLLFELYLCRGMRFVQLKS